MQRLNLRSVPLVLVALGAAALLPGPKRSLAGRPPGADPDPRAACKTDNPFLASPCYQGVTKVTDDAVFTNSAPAVIAFSDTPADQPQYALATYKQVGTAYGLAYNDAEPALYAGAYMKRQFPFGPSGPGAIYRIDMRTGRVSLFALVPNAGGDPHASRMSYPDADVRPLVGKSSLGDLDFNEERTELFVMNLADRQIYRFRMPDGRPLGHFPHGAINESWADADARPFGLAFHRGLLYHAVMNSAQSTGKDGEVEAYVYESNPDGGNMRQVAAIPMGYARGTIKLGPGSRQVNMKWNAWTDAEPPEPRGDFAYATHAQPMPTDIEFAGNDMLLGLRDRTSDMSAVYLIYSHLVAREEHLGMGVGDLLLGSPKDGGWKFQTVPEFFQDDALYIGAESTTGGLATIPWLNQVVSAAVGLQVPSESNVRPQEGALWFDTDSGKQARSELTCNSETTLPWPTAGPTPQVFGSAHAADGEQLPPPPPTPTAGTPPTPAPNRGPSLMGDVELLCFIPPEPAATQMPSMTASTTATPSPTTMPTSTTPLTPTPSPSPSSTASATPTPTPSPGPAYLPWVVGQP